MPFRFVHTADLHLDSPLRSLAMRNADLAALVGDSTRRALVAIVDLCLDERVDALVIAGDLYDGDQTSMKTARFLAAQMERLHAADIAVFTVRGNHDALSKITQELVLPPSAKLFGGRAEAVAVRRGDLDVVVHGLSFAKPHAPESLLPKYRRPVPDAVNLGILHTSLAGGHGHDPYAPCTVADLSDWGFDYWALGHVHARAEHRGGCAVVMPGMPQGRDINEAGAKTVSLVTIRDDRSLVIEERATSLAQFERIRVDLSEAVSWAEVVDGIERAVTAVRDATAAPHLVARLSLHGGTPLAWRLRRDRDLLLAETEHRLGGSGRIWIEKIEIAASDPRRAEPAGPADPVDELGALIRGEVLRQPDLREDVRALVKEIRDDLPPDARRFCGDDEAAFERFVDALMSESGHEIVARLGQPQPGGAEPR
ncbi:metallophosphoesterase family protein [Methylobacterium sp. JK268]